MRVILLFPGQGSQTPRMFDKDGLWCDWESDWAQLSGEAPQGRDAIIENLAHSPVTQPAIVGYSYQAFQQLLPLLSEHDIVGLAGHSLGELTATGIALGWGRGLTMALAEIRGLLMQEACQDSGLDCTMEAWLGRGLNKELIADFIDSKKNIWLLNDNSPSQIVVGGQLEQVTEEEGQKIGVGKRVRLPVSVLSHCPLLKKMLPRWQAALSIVPRGLMSYPIYNHTNLKLLSDAESAIVNLSNHLTSQVRFQEMIEDLSAKADFFIEVGPSNVLKKLVSQITSTPCLSLEEAHTSLVPEKTHEAAK